MRASAMHAAFHPATASFSIPDALVAMTKSFRARCASAQNGRAPSVAWTADATVR